jgi:hypothetical protein
LTFEFEAGQVTANDAYDGDPTYDTIDKRDSQIILVIPPRAKAAVLKRTLSAGRPNSVRTSTVAA